MNYHIGTMLIDENFVADEYGCPVCRIKKAVDSRLTEQYLGEGVMEDHTRTEVNALGFCAHHYEYLYSMRSKLGLALQASTRLKTVMKDISPVKNVKQAKKQAEKILGKQTTCVICKYLNEHMIRYYKTIAEVYATRTEFQTRLKASKGFCLEHYAELLNYSSCAGAEKENYLNDLYSAEKSRLDTLEENLLKFCDRHDYRNADKPLGEEKYALKDCEEAFYGTK